MSPYDVLAHGLRLDPARDRRIIDHRTARSPSPLADGIASGAFRIVDGIDNALRRFPYV